MRIHCQIVLLAVIICASFSEVRAKETTIWPYICHSPMYICQDSALQSGVGYHLLNLLWQDLDEFDHKLQLTPIKRILSNAADGKKELFYGLYKTPERQKFLYYSLPCRISLPTFIVVRAEDKEKMGSPVSLAALLSSEKHRFLMMKSISFGKGIDEILAQHENGKHVTTLFDTTNMGPKGLRMLLNKRVDYLLSLDSTPMDAKELNASDKFAFLVIEEQKQFETGYITAPRNQWGYDMIVRINQSLKKIVSTEEFYQLFTPLISPDQEQVLRKNFHKLILEPTMKGELTPE